MDLDKRPQSAADVLAEMKRLAATLNAGETQPLPPDRQPAGNQEVTTEWRGDAPPGRGSRRILVAGVAGAAVLGSVLVAVFGRGRDTGSDPVPPDPEGPVPKVQPAVPTKKDDPQSAGPPQPPPALNVVGAWDIVLVNGSKGVLEFRDDGKVIGESGFKGLWVQTGRKVALAGKVPRGGELKLKGELDPDGKTLRVVNPKGEIDTWRRRR
jgi:hypothetical protein